MASPFPLRDSERITLMRFPLIVAVVFIHANNPRIGLPNPEGGMELFAHLLRKILSEGLAAVAVPLLFLLSGYLFFAGPEFSRATFGRKLHSRFHTLLVPYLFWNLALLLVFALTSFLPGVGGLLGGPRAEFVGAGAFAWLDAWLGLSGAPVMYQLWFVRDLMIATLLAPLWFALYHLQPKFFMAAMLLCWLTHTWPMNVPTLTALLFFFMGGYFAQARRSLFQLDRGWKLFLLAYLVLLAVEMGGLAGPWAPYLHQFGILMGMGVALGFSGMVWANRMLAPRLMALSGAAFFLFVGHEPALGLAQKVAEKVLGPVGPGVQVALYFALPIAVILICLVLYRFMSRFFPRFLSLVTGSRVGVYHRREVT